MNAQHSRMFNRMLAIGVGLIGGSICLDAKKTGLAGHILGYSRRLETSHQALRLGIVDVCVTGPGDANVHAVDVVVISIPVRQYKHVLTQFLPVLPANCLIFDAGSTKADVWEVIDELDTQFPGLKARFIPCHPIAGGEANGPAAAVHQLFEAKNCVICPSGDTNPAMLAKVEKFWTALGARFCHMNAVFHDEMFGAVSHLPHLLAFAYVASVLAYPKGEDFMREGGAGFRDFTRIAASSPEMWADIFQTNDAPLLQMLDQFQATLGQLRCAIEQKDRKTLEQVLGHASTYRSAWKAG